MLLMAGARTLTTSLLSLTPSASRGALRHTPQALRVAAAAVAAGSRTPAWRLRLLRLRGSGAPATPGAAAAAAAQQQQHQRQQQRTLSTPRALPLTQPEPSAAAEAAALGELDSSEEQEEEAEEEEEMEGPAGKRQRLGNGNPAAAAAGQAGGSSGGGGKQGHGARKKEKKMSPEAQARLEIQMAAREQDPEAALAVYERARAEGLSLTPDSYASLLYLCSGGDAWESQLPSAAATAAAGAGGAQQQQQEGDQEGEQQQQGGQQQGQAAAEGPSQAASAAAGEEAASANPSGAQQQAAAAAPGPRPDAAALLPRAQQIFDEMQAAGGKLAPIEMCYTALARLAALSGDGAAARAMADRVLAAGLAPRLRSFTPALVAFAEAGQADAAFEVYAAIQGQGLELTEAEYGRLLQAASAAPPTPASWQRARGVLLAMGHELTVLQPLTLQRVRALFGSPAASCAFVDDDSLAAAAAGDAAAADGAAADGAGGSGNGNPAASQQQQQERRWDVAQCTVDDAGVCSSCGGQLASVDLGVEEFATFAEGIASLAAKQGKHSNDFQQFKEWLVRNGPFGVVVDAANVAFYGQNFASGGFNFGQIREVVQQLQVLHPGVKPLVVLHVARTRAAPAQEPAAQALLEELRAAGSFYATPPGSNDDWYWMYAAVAAGGQGLLVSNDEMRDHIFQLLAPRYFLKWKQRHQLKYTFNRVEGPGSLALDYPPHYTTCLQELSCGAWLFPGSDGSWLCAKPTTAAAAGPAAAAAAGEQHAAASWPTGGALIRTKLSLGSKGWRW